MMFSADLKWLCTEFILYDQNDQVLLGWDGVNFVHLKKFVNSQKQTIELLYNLEHQTC